MDLSSISNMASGIKADSVMSAANSASSAINSTASSAGGTISSAIGSMSTSDLGAMSDTLGNMSSAAMDGLSNMDPSQASSMLESSLAGPMSNMMSMGSYIENSFTSTLESKMDSLKAQSAEFAGLALSTKAKVMALPAMVSPAACGFGSAKAAAEKSLSTIKEKMFEVKELGSSLVASI